ncbi:MAG TPA: DUF488 domain-containing protein [Streptosporangiaceae bacterium]
MRLLTVGHGTADRDEFAALLRDAAVAGGPGQSDAVAGGPGQFSGVETLVDVRTAPGSRRFPHFSRTELADWLPAEGISYQWERDLGGFRKPSPDSPNTALRNPSFRGYADYMSTDQFRTALDRVLACASDQVTTIMCAETLWWRCHRRLIADFATLVRGAEVLHLGHDGRLTAHELTSGVRRGSGDTLRYDGGQATLLGADV